MTRFLGLFAILLTTACDWLPQYCEGEIAPAEDAPPIVSARTVAQVLPTESTAVDILFVIDDSPSMKDEQEQLGIWSSKLFEVLSGTGELPDLHIGVTSSSVPIGSVQQCASGTGGKLHFISDVAGSTGRIRNYSGTLTEAFAQMAKVGASGCGFEQPFKAARLALSNPDAAFLRDDALLLVVFVTDEDDCSADPSMWAEPTADACTDLGTFTSFRCFEHGVKCYDGKGSREFGERTNCRPDENSRYVESVSTFASFLKHRKPNPAQVVVAAIYGKPTFVETTRDERVTTHDTPRLVNVCGTGGPEGKGAAPAIRINALLAQFGGRASQSSICDSELSWAMRDVGLVTYGAATRSRCLRGKVRDPGSCRVEATSDTHHAELRPCDGTTSRCFTIETDDTCETDTKLAFRVADTDDAETLTVTCDVD